MPYSRKNKKFFDLKYEKIGKKDDFLKYIIEMDKIDYSKDGIKHINIEELLFI